MLTLRENLTAATKIVRAKRNTSWAFQTKERIKNIFGIKDYPSYHPGIIVPEYTCVMHSKYDDMRRASTENFTRTILRGLILAFSGTNLIIISIFCFKRPQASISQELQ